MRSKLLAVLVGCGLVVATMATALACDYYKTTATNDNAPPQQTAQSQTPAPASETHSN